MRPTNLSSLTRHLQSPPAAQAPVDARHSDRIVSFRGSRGEFLRIAALDKDTVRVQVWPEGRPRLDRSWVIANALREGRERDDLSAFPCPELTEEQVADAYTTRFTTGTLSVEVRLSDARLSWFNGKSVAFARDLSTRAYCYDRAGRMVSHYLERNVEERYYGFGEKSGAIDNASPTHQHRRMHPNLLSRHVDKHGRRLKMYNLDALGYNAETSDPLYKHWPIYITLCPVSGVAYGLIYDNLSTCVFDLGQEHDNYYHTYRYWQADDGDVDYTLVLGPTVADVVMKISKLIGLPALLPRWTLGYLGSTMSYTDAPNAQERLREFVDLCHKHDIPCDLFHLSSGYSMSDETKKRYVFVWNRNRVPDPKAMVDHFHSAGVRLAANIKPCLLLSHPHFKELAAKGAFVRSADDPAAPQLNMFWGGDGAHLDFTNGDTYEWWQAQVRDHILSWGIDATWNDNNEFCIPDDTARCLNFGSEIAISQIRPVQTLLMTRASYEAQRQHRKDERPYLITRAGCPGVQRYAQTWSGDNVSSWHTLKFNVPMGLGMSVSGAPNVGHDVGGFAGAKPEPELWLRWLQNGVLTPRFTIHSWHSDGSVNEPWMYPEVLPIVRSIMALRYRLVPYLYTLHANSTRTGEPIIRPLVYHFPLDVRCQTESFDYMLGPHILVACVFEHGARTRDVYLPSGVRWCDFYTGAWHDGGKVVTVDAPLDRVPMLVREGAVIPVCGGDASKTKGEGPREVFAYPAPHDGGEGRVVAAYTWTEDDGVSMPTATNSTEVTLELRSLAPRSLHPVLTKRGNYVTSYSNRIPIALPLGDTRLCVWSEVE